MSDRIKVLHIIKSLGRGGAETLLPETLKVHDTTRFEFQYIYFLPWKNQMVDELRAHGAKVVCFPAGNNATLLLRAWKVARYVKENKIELIHAHLPWAGVLAKVVGKLTGVKVIYTEHNKQERYHWATRMMNLATMNMLTEIIAVSADVASSIEKHKPKLRAALRIVLNGVNIERFAPAEKNNALKESLGIPADAIVIGTIAVFRFQKRLDVWLEIARQIVAKRPGVHFVVVGDGPLNEKLKDKQAELKLEKNVHFAGLQTEVRPYLSIMDIYMMSSIFEGLPIALLEAMAAGCAVVTTDAGGIKEVVRDRSDGLVCSVDAYELLVPFALEFIDDAEKRKTYGQKARQRIVERFSMKSMVTQLENIYFELTSSSRHKR